MGKIIKKKGWNGGKVQRCWAVTVQNTKWSQGGYFYLFQGREKVAKEGNGDVQNYLLSVCGRHV